MPKAQAAKAKLLESALSLIRTHGFAATTVDDLCADAGVTKGAFFHYFKSKQDLGVAAADHWTAVTGALFEQAPYHELEDPTDRVLAYVAFRRSLIAGDFSEFTCLVGTMLQEVYDSAPEIRAACAKSILSHCATLESDLAAALAAAGRSRPSASSLARHTQTVIQGAFILAKATGDPDTAKEALDHLDRYIRMLVRRSETQETERRSKPSQSTTSKEEPLMPEDKIAIENVNTPGKTTNVNRAKYEAMRKALLRVLPSKPPGLSVADAKAALLPRLPDAIFPGGSTAGWWLKAVQLDLEAKRIIARAPKPPVRLYRL